MVQNQQSDLVIATQVCQGKTMKMTRQYFHLKKLSDLETMIKNRIKNCSKTGQELNQEGAGDEAKPQGKR